MSHVTPTYKGILAVSVLVEAIVLNKIRILFSQKEVRIDIPKQLVASTMELIYPVIRDYLGDEWYSHGMEYSLQWSIAMRKNKVGSSMVNVLDIFLIEFCFLKIFIHLFIWLSQVLVVAPGGFSSCGIGLGASWHEGSSPQKNKAQTSLSQVEFFTTQPSSSHRCDSEGAPSSVYSGGVGRVKEEIESKYPAAKLMEKSLKRLNSISGHLFHG